MSISPKLYENTLAGFYDEELEAAEVVGVAGVPCPGAEFNRLAAEGERLVFVVTEHRELIVALQVFNGFEIRHPVLAKGQRVLAAGEIEVLQVGAIKLVTDLTNKSGHYEPHTDSLKVAVEVLTRLGYDVPSEVVRPYPGE